MRRERRALGLREWTRVQFSEYTMNSFPLPRLSMVLIDFRLTQMLWRIEVMVSLYLVYPWIKPLRTALTPPILLNLKHFKY